MNTSCCRSSQPQPTRLASPGTVLSDFTLPTASAATGITEVSLSELLKSHSYLLLWTFPRAFTYVCPTEIRKFDEHLQDFARLDCAVLCMSTDSVQTLYHYLQTSPAQNGVAGVKLVFASDRPHKISRLLGALNFDSGDCKRCTFIIDRSLQLRFVEAVDGTVGRHVENYLDDLASIKKRDETGKMCPASWKEGMPTLDNDAK